MECQCVPGIVLKAGDSAVKQTMKYPALLGAYIKKGENNNKQEP